MTKGKENSLKKELKDELYGIITIAVSLFIFLCIWQGSGDNELSTVGAIGSIVNSSLKVLFGSGKIILPLMLFFTGVSKLFRRVKMDKLAYGSWIGIFLALLIIFHLRLPEESMNITAGWEGAGGGVVGGMLSRVTLALFGKVGSYIFLTACLAVFLLGLARKTILEILRSLYTSSAEFFSKTRMELAEYILEETEEDDITPPKDFRANKEKYKDRDIPVILDHSQESPPPGHKDVGISPALVKPVLKLVKDKETAAKKGETVAGIPLQIENYKKPPFDLLRMPAKIKSQRMNKDITDNVRILEDTLDNFGVKARVTQVSRGPSITRYEIQPLPGVKVSKIVSLADDIALSLAAPQVRIEAPIPGKAAVGIEVPNEEISMVSLREVLETVLFQESTSQLTIALGKDIAGNPIVADLGKMPHLLIAGATGSGKSVCMNAIIASILFKAKPDEVKLLMIDPKVVELSNFNGIPHLISPVVTDPKKAATTLRWAVHEMENRYELFAASGVKDITRYNEVKKKENPAGNFPLLPYIVVLIDELADLMMVAPADVEDAICRLAQMARAAGIHLVVATQRPSVDVITGVIKANIPSRIAFAVSSQTDSRTILDMGGAERLLGRGDMLFYPTGMAKPIRVQGVFVSDQEIEDLVGYLREQKTPQYINTTLPTENEIQEETEDDELLAEAARIFIESGQASISLLQRRLRIGYTRAARIIDQLEQKGIVGGYEGSKPRSIRMSWEEYERTFSS